jgi:hypothetical protein
MRTVKQFIVILALLLGQAAVNHPIAVTDVPLEGPAMTSAGDHAVSAPLIVG